VEFKFGFSLAHCSTLNLLWPRREGGQAMGRSGLSRRMGHRGLP